MVSVNCDFCGIHFQARRSTAKFCSDNCRVKSFVRKKYSNLPSFLKVPENGYGGSNFNIASFDEVGLYESSKKQIPLEVAYEKPVIDLMTPEILKLIAAIKAEAIPKERDTSLGRKIWHKEQANRISQLQKQIK